MDVIRAKVCTWTSSFRYPLFISGYQPTLLVPPFSTVYGLLSAIAGKQVTPKTTSLGFSFSSEGGGVDLETIYEIDEKLVAKSNVLRREQLFNCELLIYVDDLDFVNKFNSPYYPILIGRSTDLAFVNEIKRISLKKVNSAKCKGTMVPFGTKGAHGMIHSLPSHFSDTIPRKAIGTKIFYIIEKETELYGENLYEDPETGSGVYIYSEK